MVIPVVRCTTATATATMEQSVLHVNQANKNKVRQYWASLDAADPDALFDAASAFLPDNFCCKGSAPLGTLRGPEALAKQFLAPLKRAIPDLQRQIHLFMGGQSSDHVEEGGKDAYWVAGTGYLTGTATQQFLGIPARQQPLRIRWSEFIRFDGEHMVESQMIIDFVDWFDQIGLPVLPRSRGAEHVFPAPTGYDGVLSEPQNTEDTELSLKLGNELLYGALNGFDQKALGSMGMAGFFHPNLKWYGPGGIGACLSFTEFEQLHQQHWLVAFPDRKVVGIESLFAEGLMLAASGVAGVEATQTGPYLGVEASGAHLKISGIDFWLRSETQFTENWVFVDMIDLFNQMGVDLFDRMATLRDHQSTAL